MTAPEIWLYMLFSYIIYQYVTPTAHKVRSILFKTFFLFRAKTSTNELLLKIPSTGLKSCAKIRPCLVDPDRKAPFTVGQNYLFSSDRIKMADGDADQVRFLLLLLLIWFCAIYYV